MTTPRMGALIVMPQRLARFEHAITCHKALCDILREACQQTVLAGHLQPDEAFHLQRIARQRDSGFARACVERVFALKQAGVRHE